MHDHQHFNPVIFLIVVIAMVVIGIFAWRNQKKRAAALASVAATLGLAFDPSYRSATALALTRRLEALKPLHHGGGRLARNILQGTYQGQPVTVCDYQYTVNEGKNSHTEHFQVTALELPKAFPTLSVTPENILERAADAVGFGDIDFESAEFSRTFWVTGTDKKFAYDFCNARMIEFLLTTPKLMVQVDGTLLAVIRRGLGRPDTVATHLDHLLQLRGLMPDYLFADNA